MSVYEVGPFHLRAERLALAHAGRSVGLGPRVVATLLALIERAGEPVAKEALMERVWPDGFVEESNLAQNVHVLRKTFRRYGAPDPIETVPRFGYRLTAPVRRLEEPESSTKRTRRLPYAWAAAALVAAIVAGASMPRGAALSPDGKRMYAIARYYWNLRTSDGVQKSLGYFERVIDDDPQSPLGYAGMADANLTMGDYCYGVHRPAFYFMRARAYALKALALDDRSVPAHATLGFVMLHERDYSGALAELRRAISLDGTYGPAREWYGIALARRDRLGEARPQLISASLADPLSASTTAWLSRVAYREGRFSDAAAYWQETLDLAPGLANRRHARGHPTSSSIEDTER
jgi:DNA-binding winged helix-turn-helix (wHTH) protein